MASVALSHLGGGFCVPSGTQQPWTGVRVSLFEAARTAVPAAATDLVARAAGHRRSLGNLGSCRPGQDVTHVNLLSCAQSFCAASGKRDKALKGKDECHSGMAARYLNCY